MVEHVVRVNPKWVVVHPRLVRDLGVKAQRDVDIPVVLDLAVKRWRPRVIGHNHVSVGQRVVAIDVDCILGDLLEPEQEE